MRIRDIPMIFIAFVCWAAFVGPSVAQEYKPLSTQIINTTTTLATSAAIDANSEVLRLVCSAACYVSVMSTPIVTGVTTPVYLPAAEPLYLGNRGAKVIVVNTTSGTGILHITEMSK